MKKNVIVIIPNFNGTPHLDECLSSLEEQSYKDFKILVIDDGSTDDSIGIIKKRYPRVELMINEKNIGFTQSVNKAIVYAIKEYAPEYIALLNNDTRVDKDWLKNLVKAIVSKEKVAGVSSNMMFYDKRDTINSQGGGCNFIGLGKDINFGKKINEIKKTRRYVIAPCFGACLISTRYLKEIGLLDERYFSYCEDLDWGMRANKKGYRIIFEKNAIVYHKFSASWKDNEAKKIYLCYRNSLCTIIKNYDIGRLIPALVLTILYYIAFFLAYLFNRKFKDRKLIKVNDRLGFKKRINHGIQPFLGIAWNIKELKNTIGLRRSKK